MRLFQQTTAFSICSLVLTFSIVASAMLMIGGCALPAEKETAEKKSKLISSRKVIRFYAANKLGQEDRLTTVRDTDRPGCHDLFRMRKAYRVAVVGFESCSVFSEPGCPASAAMKARWDGKARRDANKAKPTSRLTVGTSWIIGIEGAKKPNVRIASWTCS